MQDKLARNYAQNPDGMADYKYSVQYGQKWVGHRVWDCSGLTKWAAAQHGISYHHGSNSMWNYDMKYKGKLAKGMELPVGAYVYTGNDQKNLLPALSPVFHGVCAPFSQLWISVKRRMVSLRPI